MDDKKRFQPTPIGDILTRAQERLARPAARKKTVWRGRPGEIKPLWAILGEEPPYDWQPPESPVPRGPVPLGRGGMDGPPDIELMSASDESDKESKPESGAASPGISVAGPPAPSTGPIGGKPAPKTPEPGGTFEPNPGIAPAPKPSGLGFLGTALDRISDGIDAGLKGIATGVDAALDRADQKFQGWVDGSMLNREDYYRFHQNHQPDQVFPNLNKAGQADKLGFVPVPDYQNSSHRVPDPGSGVNNENNFKRLSPDGKWELVFDKNGNILTRPANRGTFNVVPASESWTGHFVNDVVPALLYGNSPDDPTTFWQRAAAYGKGVPGIIDESLPDEDSVLWTNPGYGPRRFPGP